MLSSYLAAARAFSSMSVKAVANALRVSDKKITQIEQNADLDDPKVKQLIQLYTDWGIVFEYDDNHNIIGMTNAPQFQMLRLSFTNYPNPFDKINALLHQLRHIRGITTNLWLRDRAHSSIKDSLDMQIPIDVRDLVVKLLSKWIKEEGPFLRINDDGSETLVTENNVSDVIIL